MKKRVFLLGGAFVMVSVLAFLAGRASKGKGPLASLILKDVSCKYTSPKTMKRTSVQDFSKGSSLFQDAPSEIHNDMSEKIPSKQPALVSQSVQAADEAERDKPLGLEEQSEAIDEIKSQPEREEEPEEMVLTPPAPYILSTNTRKFHRPTCREVKKIRPQHYAAAYSRKEAMGMNCSPCQRCKP
ncbi:hypothetical protein NIF40_11285 [[Clostridium] leptum]|uniref:Ada DNA repair metal-binding domain-containing protein n=1 Tax=Solibaculum mannosilyticum TaxID=2780922 RepID=A0A7I8D058_9FIRM|nr:hypothetical protein [Solibaculum mannosilyticum]MCO7138109.1 hypothetical protein [[Clostridium] leptum]BCI60151.1 hypothetical protein C12CBH8_07900 [Solibaculum mannosilyticum]